jgi:hypothetical protein
MDFDEFEILTAVTVWSMMKHVVQYKSADDPQREPVFQKCF